MSSQDPEEPPLAVRDASRVDPLRDGVTDEQLTAELFDAAAALAQEAHEEAQKIPVNRTVYGSYMTRTDLAEAAGMRRKTVYRIMNGQGPSPPTLLSLARLARAAGRRLKLTLE